MYSARVKSKSCRTLFAGSDLHILEVINGLDRTGLGIFLCQQNDVRARSDAVPLCSHRFASVVKEYFTSLPSVLTWTSVFGKENACRILGVAMDGRRSYPERAEWPA